MADPSSSAQLAARPPPQDGAYILRRLVSDLPLSADGQSTDVRITCVEVWNSNLYVGTSASEILHFVLLPPHPNDPSPEPTAIIASRLQPAYTQAIGVGIQQILLLPKVNKACILCNNTLTFYSLPELSPAFPSTKPLTCSWVGGVDLNADGHDSGDDGVVVMLCLRSRIRMVRVLEEGPRSLRTIEYGGCLTSLRRDNFSCAADSHSYALLDVEHQQKIGLFPISSLDPDARDVGGAAEDIATALSNPPSRSVSSAGVHPRHEEQRGHGRSTSLGIFGAGGPASLRTESPRPPGQRYGFDVPESLSRAISPAPGTPSRSPDRQHPERTSSLPRASTPSQEKPLPPAPESTTAEETESPQKQTFVPLKPHVASPSPTEFLLTVGTTPSEPGVGMFVNLDGDMCRGSIQFSSYPDAIVVDGTGIDMSTSMRPDMEAEEGYVLAVVHREDDGQLEYGVEIQRWDVDAGEGEASKEWLDLNSLRDPSAKNGERVTIPLGIRTVVEANDLVLSEIGDKLSVKRLEISSSEEASSSRQRDKGKRTQEKEDLEFTARLSKLHTRTVLWAKNEIWWAVRNPLVTRLDARLEYAQSTSTGDGVRIQPNRSLVEAMLGDIRGQEPRNESEYLSLIYIRQKASILLFMELILRSSTNIIIFENEKRITEQSLVDGEVDPRVILSLLPILNKEVIQGPDGIQISGGITTLVEQFLHQNDLSAMPTTVNGPFGDNLLHLVRRYLLFWKKRRGMASVTNDPYLFQSVDAALLHILLLLDRDAPKGPATAGSLRAELNDLVDNEVECFDRAIELLEHFKRLYVLSRFYQRNSKASAKASKVLGTWRRILDGEPDEGGEFVDGELELRKYLSRIRDQALVEEYGAWLANRNPRLGVQIFADDHSRVKFEPTRAVALLKEKAPGAVKEYLEYLVFGKKHTQYVNELIAFYLDIVVTELQTSAASRSTLLQTYETYRALHPHKPTYRQFITENSRDAEWWDSRLRLLQLLGSNQTANSSYDVPSILARLEPFEQELVPEMIILNGRQGRHQEAIRLLTHGLGDFDTAINYCLLGGSSIFRSSGYIPQEEIPGRDEQAVLFGYLLQEFLRIDDLSQRVERTGELLERFGGWFDIAQVLEIIPNDWSVDIFSGFLINALRRLVREKSESDIVKALSGAQNLQLNAELVDRIEELGPRIERVK
ncbi:uncharacterized protein BDR25DRAFT_293858 [Lindgomyces ingoldianus]|uniref:Uncharacterized protein n=1 Tax=Lindgomyces ingoldianus TaxID=673940 RepID=A0ACB6QJT6_9PLEO|nr:uncharacterized protein BDR25DRAFT_293858 [Lindgomyces ingoldianus]KAF2466387.1 hypothetical protein BDR25DRAFT_293858 [Lindgomyces ingoldianus]